MSTTDPRRWVAERLYEHDILAMATALTHILDLHSPKPPTEHGTECRGCSNPTTWAAWPCATVLTIVETPLN